jgi:hypothetical protein
MGKKPQAEPTGKFADVTRKAQERRAKMPKSKPREDVNQAAVSREREAGKE